MKHLKSTLALVLIVAMLATLMVGCGGTAQTAENPSAAENGGKVTLTMINTTDFEKTTFSDLEGTFAKFPDKAPNVNIEAEFLPWTEVDSKLFLANAGNEYYDIVLVNVSTLPALIQAGILADMTPYAEADNFDPDEVFTPAMANLAQYGNGIYALPFETDTRVLAVNTKILEEENLELPETKEDMLEIAKAVTKDLDGDGINDQFGYSMNISRTLPCIYIQGNWLVSNGLHVYEVEDDGNIVCNLDSKDGVDFFEWAAEMGKYMPNDMISYDNAMIDNAFASGKFAMYTYGAWMHTRDEFKKTVEDNNTEYKLILNPAGTAGHASTSGGWMLGVSSKCQNKQAAWDFIKFMVDPEVNASVCSALPPVKDAYQYPPFNDEKYDILAEQLLSSETPVEQFIPEFNDIVEIYGTNLISAILGEQEPAAAAKAAAESINALLKNKGYQK